MAGFKPDPVAEGHGTAASCGNRIPVLIIGMIRKKLHTVLIYPFKVLVGCIAYASYFLSIAIFLFIGVPLLLLLLAWRPGLMKACMYRTLKAYAFFLTRLWLPALRVYSIAEISGYDRQSSANSIFVANHRGRLDALLLLSILPESGVLIKPKYARIPIYSTFVKYLDFVCADASSPSSLAAALKRCADILSKGKSLLVFPEGTRAKSGKLQSFKDFSFKVALETGRSVVPVIIHTDYPFLARTPQSIFPKYRFRYTVRFLPGCTGKEHERPSDFAARVHDIMSNALTVLNAGTCWDTSVKSAAGRERTHYNEKDPA
jgi:1-acyl-sn-glycerol-3-phosphate acyltransferase